MTINLKNLRARVRDGLATGHEIVMLDRSIKARELERRGIYRQEIAEHLGVSVGCIYYLLGRKPGRKANKKTEARRVRQ